MFIYRFSFMKFLQSNTMYPQALELYNGASKSSICVFTSGCRSMKVWKAPKKIDIRNLYILKVPKNSYLKVILKIIQT